MTGSVYFVQAESGAVKIGYARKVHRRLAALQTAHHEELRVIRSIRAEQGAETWLHRHFAEHAIRGEWFRFVPEMLAIEPPVFAPAVQPDGPAGIMIDQFGGLHAMARALGHTYPTTVQGWKSRGVIPLRQIPRVVAAAKEHGIKVDEGDLIPRDRAA